MTTGGDKADHEQERLDEALRMSFPASDPTAIHDAAKDAAAHASVEEGVFRDNVEKRRYELEVSGGTAVALYNLIKGRILITETIVPPALEGRGLAGRLAKLVLADIAKRGILLMPVCPFFSAYLKKHPEYRDIVDPDYRTALGLGSFSAN